MTMEHPPFFNRRLRYIFKWLFLSIVLLVFGGVDPHGFPPESLGLFCCDVFFYIPKAQVVVGVLVGKDW